MAYEIAAKTGDIADGGKMKVTLGGQDILLTRFGTGYYAISNKCTHMGGSLFDGILDGEQIICPRHGSAFNVKTGKALHGGKLLFVKFNVDDVRAFPVTVDGEDILVGIE